MRKLLAFLNNLDARAWRTVFVILALLAGVAALAVLGQSSFLGWSADVEHWLESLRSSPWAFPATIALFTVTSFIAAPQFLLQGFCVIAFGPWLGSVHAMVGTVLSSWLHFYMGRWGGRQLVERYGGRAVDRLSRFIGKNNFMASTIIRNVPTAPAIVVNMAFGASHAKFWPYIAGVAVGSSPKIAVVAIFGEAMAKAVTGGVGIAIAIGAVAVGLWIAFSLAARKAVRGGAPDGDDASDPPADPDPAVREPVQTSAHTSAHSGG